MFIIILLLLALLVFALPDFVIEAALKASINAVVGALDLILNCFDILQEAIKRIVMK